MLLRMKICEIRIINMSIKEKKIEPDFLLSSIFIKKSLFSGIYLVFIFFLNRKYEDSSKNPDISRNIIFF